LYVEEKRAAFDLVSHATEYSPQRVITIRKFYKNEAKNKYSSYTDDKDVVFIINTRITKNSYHKTRLGAKKHEADIYSSYDRVQLAKDR
jgi:hypothetical protein